MRAVYAGHEALTFTDYTDLGTGRTLHAEPGQVYDIAPASGRTVPDIPAPWFAAAEGTEPAWADDPERAQDASWDGPVPVPGPNPAEG